VPNVLSLLLGRIYADKDAQEWIIRRSRLDWTIVRPTVLTTGPHIGAYRARLALRVHLARAGKLAGASCRGDGPDEFYYLGHRSNRLGVKAV
jgi:hypothetical protein